MSTVRDALAPRSPGGRAPGAVMSLLVHGALLAALAWGVGWRSPPPVAVSAELWAATPQTAAPALAEAPPPPPPPTPAPAAPPAPPPRAEADIALERARLEKAQRDKAAEEQARRERDQQAKAEREKADRQKAEKREKAEREKEREKADKLARERQAEAKTQAQLEQQRKENLERMMGQLGGKGAADSKGTAAADAAPSRSYAGLLRRAIGEIFYAGSGNPSAVVEVRSAPGGTIIGRRLVKPSGDREWDEAVLKALDRLASLPKDVDGRVPPAIEIALRPRE